MAVAVAVSGGVAVPVALPVAVPVAGFTKRFFHQNDFSINVWSYNCLSDRFVQWMNFVNRAPCPKLQYNEKIKTEFTQILR